MELKTIFKKLNDSIQYLRQKERIKNKSFFIHTESIVPDIKFPAYKKFKYILWLVSSKNQYKIIVVESNEKVTTEEEKLAAKSRVEAEFISQVFDLLLIKEEMNDIITGKFEKYKINETSN